MRILLSNDDGVHAPGLRAMAKELRKLGEVWVVAPTEEKSTTGHSLTIHKPLRLIPAPQYGDRFFAVDGSPADCVYLGIREVIGKMPDLVVSGINRGGNLGQDVYYSGTVSAAREACILGIRAMAVSLSIDFSKSVSEDLIHYDAAAKVAAEVLRSMKRFALPQHTMMNLNVPDLPLERIKGLKLARQGFRFYSGNILRRMDHRGKHYFWVGGQYKGFKNEEGSDCAAVDQGFASLTPLKLDSTDLQCLAAFANADAESDLFKPKAKRGKSPKRRKG